MSRGFESVKSAWRLAVFLALLLGVVACSRGTASSADQEAKQEADDSLSLKLNALNYTDVPVGIFYVNGTWGGTAPGRIGSGGGSIICCVDLPKKWHPGLSVDLTWQDDNLYKKDPKAMAFRVVPVEKYDYFSDGFLWVLFFPDDKIKVYASQWMPGFPGFPEGLQAPDEACPDNFKLLNSDARCLKPDPRIKL
ncbi:DUF3304 domain-containing protein [Paraburkholderia silviterrae]|uniref:DUF3304 domain-containing protein n=1 Tax=Paraburkholderia silviterrae TaxID=2528715 RepID=A0A4R5LY97_9BURK|nr:DUF3304 domain-containing protein [Paraburkholderia silviterrae]TDG16949.1 DUF3304 domain-containing protein [Paraburkholderia silviterrae]